MSPVPELPVRLEAHAREPFAEAYRFTGIGAYKVLTATAHYAVDPKAAAYRAIPDLDLVPPDVTGKVCFSGDVEILRPVDGGRRRLFFDWGNRGNKRALPYFCDAPHTNGPRTLTDAGNGYLMRRGYTVVFGAWQGDLLPGDGRLLLDLPVARRGAEPVRGLTTAEFIHRLRRTVVAELAHTLLKPGGCLALCWSTSPWAGAGRTCRRSGRSPARPFRAQRRQSTVTGWRTTASNR